MYASYEMDKHRRFSYSSVVKYFSSPTKGGFISTPFGHNLSLKGSGGWRDY